MGYCASDTVGRVGKLRTLRGLGMDKRHRRLLSDVLSRMAIVALVSALLCTMVGTAPESVAHHQASRVVLTAAIDDSSTTLGFADSDLTNTGMTQAQIDQQLDKMQSLGVQNVHILIPWVTIEERQGEYNWDYVDYIVEAASSRGMGILGVINQTPVWAGVPVMAGMPDPAVFGGFAENVATRYAGKISAYEIWNEPNAINSLDPVDPAAYTRLLQAAYPLMKQADPTITVIGGVVGAGATLGPLTMNPDDFVEGMYAAGAKGYFDALSFHPYEYSMQFSAGAGVAGSPLEQLQKIMQIMATHGDADLKVWASEYGQPTTGQYTEQQQAEFIRDFLKTWPQMAGTGPMFLYTLQDTHSGSSNLQDNFGVYDSDGTAKQAVQVIIDFLNGGPTDPVDPRTHRSDARRAYQPAHPRDRCGRALVERGYPDGGHRPHLGCGRGREVHRGGHPSGGSGHPKPDSYRCGGRRVPRQGCRHRDQERRDRRRAGSAPEPEPAADAR